MEISQSPTLPKLEPEKSNGIVNLQNSDLPQTLVSSTDAMAMDDITPRSSMDSLIVSSSGSETVYPFTKSHSRNLSLNLKNNSSPSLTRKHELLLWSFAQVVGHFMVDGLAVNQEEFEPLKAKTIYKPVSGFGGGGGATGGGTLGITGPNALTSSSSADGRGRIGIFKHPLA